MGIYFGTVPNSRMADFHIAAPVGTLAGRNPEIVAAGEKISKFNTR